MLTREYVNNIFVLIKEKQAYNFNHENTHHRIHHEPRSLHGCAGCAGLETVRLLPENGGDETDAFTLGKWSNACTALGGCAPGRDVGNQAAAPGVYRAAFLNQTAMPGGGFSWANRRGRVVVIHNPTPDHSQSMKD